jgi:hypothetical protein
MRIAISLPNGSLLTAAGLKDGLARRRPRGDSWWNEIRVKTGIVEIDTTGGPGFGLEHIKQYNFLRDKEFGFEHLLRDKEIVLTFDEGPGRESRNRQNDCREPRHKLTRYVGHDVGDNSV